MDSPACLVKMRMITGLRDNVIKEIQALSSPWLSGKYSKLNLRLVMSYITLCKKFI